MQGSKVRKSRLFFLKMNYKPIQLSGFSLIKQADIERVNILENWATRNQNQTLHPQKLKRRVHKHKKKENHQTKKMK